MTGRERRGEGPSGKNGRLRRAYEPPTNGRRGVGSSARRPGPRLVASSAPRLGASSARHRPAIGPAGLHRIPRRRFTSTARVVARSSAPHRNASGPVSTGKPSASVEGFRHRKLVEIRTGFARRWNVGQTSVKRRSKKRRRSVEVRTVAGRRRVAGPRLHRASSASPPAVVFMGVHRRHRASSSSSTTVPSSTAIVSRRLHRASSDFFQKNPTASTPGRRLAVGEPITKT